MQALHIKYIAPTNTRGTRIKVTAACGSKIYPWDYELESEANYMAAGIAFVSQPELNWLDPTRPRPLTPVLGSLPDGTWAMTFNTSEVQS